MLYNSRPGEDDVDEFDEFDPKPCKQSPPPEVGSGYERKPEYEQSPPSEFGSGFGRRPKYGEQESEFGSGYGRRAEYEGGGIEYGNRYGWWNEDESGSGERTTVERRPIFFSSEEEEEGYGKPSYRRKYDDSDDEKRKSYGCSGEKGYGRKIYEDISTLSLPCVGDTRKVLAKVLNRGWFKLILILFLVVTSGPRDVRSEDIGNPLIPGSTAMNALLANKNLRGLTLGERRQMLGTETPINNNDFPWGNSPPNSPAHEQANRYQRDCKIENRCRQGSKGKKN